MARPTSQKTVVSRLFSASERPIYLLDAGGRIVFGNQALADWLNVSVDHLVGMKCVWSGDADNTLNRLALPPHAKDHKNYSTTITVLDDDEATHRQANFIALKDKDEFGSWLVVLGDLEQEEPENSPFDVDGLHRALQKLQAEWREEYKLDCLVGRSVAIQQVRSQVQVATQSFARCVVTGNVGSGRELVARTIYSERPTVQAQLAPLSCWLIDAEQMHKMLQEFVRHQKEMGDEHAPVLLLLDVDELDVEAQLVLSRMLYDSEFQWQTLATSKTSLTQLAADGNFANDLAYTLTDLEISIPTLSNRLDDIPLLAQWALERSPHANKRTGFAADAMESLLRYSWPREVEELKEVVNGAAATATTSQITKDDLPQKLKFAEDAAVLPDVEDEQIKLDDFLAEVEAELISRALRRSKGNRAQAARSLGISRGKLLRRIEQLKVDDRESE